MTGSLSCHGLDAALRGEVSEPYYKANVGWRSRVMYKLLGEKRGKSGSMCIEVSCNLHKVRFPPRHVKYSFYFGKYPCKLDMYCFLQ